jgi:membrane carboxypeptidase/penicillin-binding protein
VRKLLLITAKSVLVLLAVAVVTLLVASGWLVWHYERALPDVRQLAANSPTGPICSRGNHGAYVSLAEIPPLLRQAVTAVEEPDFYERTSLNPFVEIAFGMATNRRPRPSGITFSVTRCLESLSPDCCKGPSLERQVGSLFLMGRIVRAFSRDRILEIYLNETYFGRGAYGVVAASEAYFGRPLDRLSIDEIAFIVALPRAPTYLGRNKDRATERRNFVIERMLRASAITEAQALFAKDRPLEFRDEAPNGQSEKL